MKKTGQQEDESLREKLLRLPKKSGLPEVSTHPKEIVHINVSTSDFCICWKQVETALLKAEYKKARALMEWQKRRLIL